MVLISLNSVDARIEQSNNATVKNKAFCIRLFLEIKNKPAQKNFLNNVGSHAKNQPLLGTNEKKPENVS